MNKTNFFLTKFPLISVLIFYSFCLIAAFFYPGSEKEIINYKSQIEMSFDDFTECDSGYCGL